MKMNTALTQDANHTIQSKIKTVQTNKLNSRNVLKRTKCHTTQSQNVQAWRLTLNTILTQAEISCNSQSQKLHASAKLNNS